jgi:hypothetical protein
VLTYLLPLLVAHLCVAGAYWFNATHGQSLARDAWTLRIAGATEVYLAVVMVVGVLFGPRRWDGVSLGLTLFFAANAPVLLRILGHVGPRVDVYGVEGNLIRAYYQVACPILVVCLTAWAIGSRFGTRHGPMAPKADALQRENEALRAELAALRTARGDGEDVVVEDRVTYQGPERRSTSPGRRATDRGA